MKKIVSLFLLLFLLKAVSGEVVITEVMYDPAQASDTDLEWIEIYNNGSEKVNLSSWRIDGNNFDDFTILPGEFIVIARELTDGTDADNDSFESAYGNNDGVWNELDENYRVFDGDFSLTNSDILNLTSEGYFEILEYNSSVGGNGNGYSIEKIDVTIGNNLDNWRESKVLYGTPGYGDVDNGNQVYLAVEVSGSLPILALINVSDDLEDNGVQIRPKIDNRSILLNLQVNSSSTIRKITAEVNGNIFELTKDFDLDNFSSVYKGEIWMNYFDKPGIYTINISAENEFNGGSSLLVDFEYLTLLAVSLNENSLNFGIVEPGTLSEVKAISVKNKGNVDVDLEIYGSDLESGNNKINVSKVEFNFDLTWNKLDYRPKLFEFNLSYGLDKNKEVSFRLDLPTNIVPNAYAGNMNMVGVEA